MKKSEVSYEEIAKQIHEIQKTSKYVTTQTEKQILEYLEQGNYLYRIDNWKVVVSIYRNPLLRNVNKEEQIYRVWWLIILDKKYVREFIDILEEHYSDKSLNSISKTDNLSVAKKLIWLWVEELTYDEAIEKYPIFINAYIDNSPKTREYYKTHMFYIHSAWTYI